MFNLKNMHYVDIKYFYHTWIVLFVFDAKMFLLQRIQTLRIQMKIKCHRFRSDFIWTNCYFNKWLSQKIWRLYFTNECNKGKKCLQIYILKLFCSSPVMTTNIHVKISKNVFTEKCIVWRSNYALLKINVLSNEASSNKLNYISFLTDWVPIKRVKHKIKKWKIYRYCHKNRAHVITL